MKELLEYCREMIVKHPCYRVEINDLYILCRDNIKEGESKDNKIEQCYSSIRSLVNE
jgi:hypothetical protein